MIKQNLTPADPTDDDVLCGSGRVVLEHPGNVRFQQLVAQKYNEYLETADSKVAKTRVTTETLREVVSTGGRFLKKHAIYDLWYVCSKQKKVGRDKISHLLRQMARRTGPLLAVQAPARERNRQTHGRQQEDQNNREAEGRCRQSTMVACPQKQLSHSRPCSYFAIQRHSHSTPTSSRMGSAFILPVCTSVNSSNVSSNVPNPPGKTATARARMRKCIFRSAK